VIARLRLRAERDVEVSKEAIFSIICERCGCERCGCERCGCDAIGESAIGESVIERFGGVGKNVI
jgi:hypothetical protein